MPGRTGLGYAGQVSPSAPDDGGMSLLQKHIANVKRKAAMERAYTGQDDMAKFLGFRMATIDPGETDMWKGMATYTPELHQQNIQSNAPPPDPAFRQSLMQSDIYRQLSAQPNPGQFETNMLQNPQLLDEATRRALLRNLQQSTATRQPPMVTTPQVR